jgi:hypothetical protein
MEDSLEGLIHGKRQSTAPPPAAKQELKRAFSTSSDVTSMEVAAITNANALATDVAAQV